MCTPEIAVALFTVSAVLGGHVVFVWGVDRLIAKRNSLASINAGRADRRYAKRFATPVRLPL